LYFHHPAPTQLYTLSLHDALPILKSSATACANIPRSISSITPNTKPTPPTNPSAAAPPPSFPRKRESRLLRALAVTAASSPWSRSEEHTSELQSRGHLVCRLLLEK